MKSAVLLDVGDLANTGAPDPYGPRSIVTEVPALWSAKATGATRADLSLPVADAQQLHPAGNTRQRHPAARCGAFVS